MQTLPIAGFRDEILGLVRDHQAVVITAETGAGKSTQVPAWLTDVGYAVTCTQPRRLAARTLAQRVAEERGERLGETIGVRTREDRAVSSRTRCVYATDGLALVRELVGDQAQCLVIDEVHEWSINVETLVAWARRRIRLDPAFRCVLMSATLDAQRLSEYLDGAPVVSVPGRLHPIDDVAPQGSVIDDAARLLSAGRNVLVFQPGRAEIEQTASDLRARGVDAELIPLHGGLAPAEQARAFARYARPKCVIATNVAQTSVTLDDIDAVVDSGMERRSEVVRGIEGLYLRPISRSDARQRRGRAGRTRPGVYVDHCPLTESSERAEYPTAEILRSRLDQTVLRLAVAGLDAGELKFFHQPRREDLTTAKQSLTALGLLGPDGMITDRG
jgi:HrpA-like RNA helicase